ncbi:MAG: hypothetical protein HY781_03200 [Chloroflexi bacterium]|nr:hypothetical protein [Chloroflexota bacterium]
MPATMITDRLLVTDHSHWDYYIKPQELIDGGVTDVILKAGSGLGVDPRFQKNGEEVAKHSQYLRLHAYWWDDPLVSANAQADFAGRTLTSSGLPVLSLWGDQEQWWSDWNKWLAARAGKLAWKDVPVFKPLPLDSHCKAFAEALVKVWPVTGLYTGRGFITSYAPTMKNWLGNYKIWFAAWGRQPPIATKMTWQELRTKWLPDYDPIFRDTGIVKENIVGHQFTGDKCILPGSYQDILGLKRKPLDVSVFQRSFMESLGEVSPGEPIEQPEGLNPNPAGTPYIFLGAHLWVRNLPNEATARLIDSLTKDQRVVVLEIQGEWARLEQPAGWVRLGWLTKL